MKKFASADDYYKQAQVWGDEQRKLREILLGTDLTETIKWGIPCYTFNDKNVVGVSGFKGYFGLWFYQGALLNDDSNVLINAQEGKTRAMRQWRMTDAKQIKPRIIKGYLKEAIALVKAGKEIKPQRKAPMRLPEQLQRALAADKAAAAAFKALRPGQQREYAEYVQEAKQLATKQRRIEKILPLISAGGGLNDRYR